MGLDLRLLPIEADNGELSFSHSILSLERQRDLLAEIQDIPEQTRVPTTFNSFCSRDKEWSDSHYGVTVETPYGEPLMAVTVKQLLRVASGFKREMHYRNRAVFAYLQELPSDMRIALYWH